MHIPSHTISQHSHSSQKSRNFMSSICDWVALVLPHTKKEQKRQSNILFCKRFDVCESIAQNGYIPKKRQEDFLKYKYQWYEAIRESLHKYFIQQYESLLKKLKEPSSASWEELPENDRKILARGFQSSHLDIERLFLDNIPELTVFAQIHSAEGIFDDFLENIPINSTSNTVKFLIQVDASNFLFFYRKFFIFYRKQFFIFIEMIKFKHICFKRKEKCVFFQNNIILYLPVITRFPIASIMHQ